MSLPDDGLDVNMVKEACWEAARKTASELFLQTLSQEEENTDAILCGSGYIGSSK